jgi:ZIP family zinc transporter
MSGQIELILPYIIIASAAGISGGVLAFFWAPGIGARSAVQHFAAGVVIAAVASDLIPEVEKIGTPSGIITGFTAGGIAMIGLKWLVVKFETRERKKQKLPVGLAAAAAVDTLVDGAIISAGFAAGQRLGTLLTIALATELTFLTLSVGAEFHKMKSMRWQGLAVTTGIALLLLIGAVGAMLFLRDVSKPAIAVFLSFGAAALIYLIAEELLVESIEAEENLLSTAMLFAGFTSLLGLKLWSRAN